MTTLYFTEEHNLFRESLREFLEREVRPNINAWEKEGRIPKSIWKKMGDMGFLGLSLPEKYGGSNLDFFFEVILNEELGRLNSGGFVITQQVVQYMSAPYIYKYGNDYLKDKYGEWILFDPIFNKNTYFLWLLPILMFFIGGAIILKLFIKKKN